MRYLNLITSALVGALVAGGAVAAPAAEEAAQLGKTLTPFGAIKGGNAAGTIPAWEGGVCTPPAGYKPIRGDQGAPYVDVFADDKPYLQITAENVAKYADKLDEGARELMRRYPKTFRIDVYPTRRSACFPGWMYENTIQRVMKPRIVEGISLADAHAQIPFPIPKSGVEAMWNALTKPDLTDSAFELDTLMVDTSGRATRMNLQDIHNQNRYWDNATTSVPEDKPYWVLRSIAKAPVSQVGTQQMRWQFLRPDQKTPVAYSYIPGQRRVRLAPEFSYDGVSASSGGILLFDEINGFDGKMDRFDFKLLGRKEIYVPYNSHKYQTAPDDVVAGPEHVNPDTLRWELHRLWVVEAALKPGERHVQKRKVFYIDEDSWSMLLYVGFDQADKPHHYMQQVSYQQYDKPLFKNSPNNLYDFSKRAYLLANRQFREGQSGVLKVKPYQANYFTPESMAGGGLR